MKLVLGLLVAALLGACGHAPGSSDSGIRGRAIVRPTCPLEPCPAPSGTPISAAFSVLKDGEVVTDVKADPRGRFSVRLGPGKYVLRGSNGVPFLKPVAVTVRPHVFTVLVLGFDSGIR